MVHLIHSQWEAPGLIYHRQNDVFMHRVTLLLQHKARHVFSSRCMQITQDHQYRGVNTPAGTCWLLWDPTKRLYHTTESLSFPLESLSRNINVLPFDLGNPLCEPCTTKQTSFRGQLPVMKINTNSLHTPQLKGCYDWNVSMDNTVLPHSHCKYSEQWRSEWYLGEWCSPLCFSLLEVNSKGTCSNSAGTFAINGATLQVALLLT